MNNINQSTKLGRILKSQHLKVFDLQVNCRINPRMLSGYLSNTYPIQPKHIAKICEYLDCTPDDVIDLENRPYYPSVKSYMNAYQRARREGTDWYVGLYSEECWERYTDMNGGHNTRTDLPWKVASA